MEQPVLAGDAFLADVRAVAGDASALYLWWLGQSGYLVQWQREVLLLDPYLSDSLTQKYAGTDRPHVRLTARVVAPERLDFVDVVTSSHNHTDHLDRETLVPLLRANPELAIVVAEANLDFAADRLGVERGRLRGIAVDAPVAVGGYTLHAVPAAHEELERDAAGHYKCVGLVVEAGPWTIYHSGDTVWYDGLPDRLRRWQIDVALLPINGRGPARGVAGNLSGEEAARLAREAGVSEVIPCHYDMFAFNTASPDAFAAAARSLGQGYGVLKCGERWSSHHLNRAEI